MSTRATLTVYDRENGHGYSIYRHSDGYPDTPHGVLATLPKALNYAWPLPRFEAMDFAAAIVAAWKTQGGNIYLTTGREAHGDTEFHYDLFPDAKGRIVVRAFEATYPNGYENDATWVRHGRDRFIAARKGARA